MERIADLEFFPLHFDANGKLLDQAEFNGLKAAAAQATDAIFLAHGFRNDEHDATRLYTDFLTHFRAQAQRPELQPNLAPRKFVAAGVFWPSKPFRESFPSDAGSVQAIDSEALQMTSVRQQLLDLHAEVDPSQAPKLEQAMALLSQVKGNPDAQDDFVDLVLSSLDHSQLDPTEGFQQIASQPGSQLLNKLTAPIIVPTQAANEFDTGGVMATGGFTPMGGEVGVQSVGSFFGTIAGKIDTFLNMTTWYVMKNRSGVVGATGVAQAVRDLQAACPTLRIHLVGHSLGGRLMAGCAKSLAQDPMLRPASLTLLEAAFSHFGFSANNGKGTPGFFRDVMARQVVKGPLLATFSMQDTVVGTVYAVASRLAGDNVKAIGDANDPFGGIGRNGAQKTTESISGPLHPPGQPYTFTTGVVNNLDGSGGLILNHGDVTNDAVTYAFASSVAVT